jgi:LPS export ABC transporter protein LptC
MMRSARLIGAAVLAGGALACSGMDAPPTVGGTADTADQIGYGVTHVLTADGIRRMSLRADSAYAYLGPQRHHLHGITVTFYAPDGRATSTVVAREGTYEWRTGNMEAQGDVVVTSPDGRRLETSILQYDRAIDRIVGPAAFRWHAPDQDVEGDGFTSDPELRNVVTTRARGALGRVPIDR